MVALVHVEDNPINQQVACYQIEKLGYSVDIANNGLEALSMLERNDYALVLMDCHMPEMDGFEATARIRQRADHKAQIPIIAVTASAADGEKEKCLQAGMDDYLSKPFHKGQLSEKIDSWLSRSSHAIETTKTANGDSDPTGPSDITRGLEQLEEDYGKAMVLKIIEMFGPDAEARRERIDHAIRERDFKELEEAAHGLKSGAANIGATKLSRLSAELETLGEEKSLGGAEELAKQLRASLILVKSQLAAYREDGPRGQNRER